MPTPQQLTVYRGCTPVLDAEYGGENDWSPVAAVVDAIATAADVDPLDVPPLHEFVDPDALNNLFDRHNRDDTQMILRFEVETWNVFVRSDGQIRVCDATQPTDPEPVFGTSGA